MYEPASPPLSQLLPLLLAPVALESSDEWSRPGALISPVVSLARPGRRADGSGTGGLDLTGSDWMPSPKRSSLLVSL